MSLNVKSKGSMLSRSKCMKICFLRGRIAVGVEGRKQVVGQEFGVGLRFCTRGSTNICKFPRFFLQWWGKPSGGESNLRSPRRLSFSDITTVRFSGRVS